MSYLVDYSPQALAICASRIDFLLFINGVSIDSLRNHVGTNEITRGKGAISVSTRIYDAENLFCYQLTYIDSFSNSKDMPQIIIDVNPFKRESRFTIESLQEREDYQLFTRTFRNTLVQRKYITVKSIDDIRAELGSLSLHKI